MQALLAFFTRSFHWIVFILLEVVSGVMLFNYNSYQGSVWLSSANAVAGQVYAWSAAVQQFFTLSRRNEELTQRNIFLEQALHRLREKAPETVVDTIGMKLIAAKVVSNSVNSLDNLLTIDRGWADGIEPDMGVVCGNGLVGVVYSTSKHYAVVLPVLNKRSHISCSLRGSEYFGYLTWNGVDPMYAYVDDIPRHAKFRKGDWVETSGYSHVFPPGIAVGKIVAIYNSADGLSYRLKIHLSTDFGCLREVCVISDKGIAERLRLQAVAMDSLNNTP